MPTINERKGIFLMKVDILKLRQSLMENAIAEVDVKTMLEADANVVNGTNGSVVNAPTTQAPKRMVEPVAATQTAMPSGTINNNQPSPRTPEALFNDLLDQLKIMANKLNDIRNTDGLQGDQEIANRIADRNQILKQIHDACSQFNQTHKLTEGEKQWFRVHGVQAVENSIGNMMLRWVNPQGLANIKIEIGVAMNNGIDNDPHTPADNSMTAPEVTQPAPKKDMGVVSNTDWKSMFGSVDKEWKTNTDHWYQIESDYAKNHIGDLKGQKYRGYDAVGYLYGQLREMATKLGKTDEANQWNELFHKFVQTSHVHKPHVTKAMTSSNDVASAPQIGLANGQQGLHDMLPNQAAANQVAKTGIAPASAQHIADVQKLKSQADHTSQLVKNKQFTEAVAGKADQPNAYVTVWVNSNSLDQNVLWQKAQNSILSIIKSEHPSDAPDIDKIDRSTAFPATNSEGNGVNQAVESAPNSGIYYVNITVNGGEIHKYITFP